VEYELRDFFKDKLSHAEIKDIAELSSVDEMFAWRSPSSKAYRNLRGEASDEELIDLMSKEPRLIRRPILSDGSQIIFGFKKHVYDGLSK
jgi:arsenate reductase-like glutaredoxin family protein